MPLPACLLRPLASAPVWSSSPRTTAVPQILLGVPQPVVGQTFAVTVLVEAQADVAPIATGPVSISWGDNTSSTVVTLSDSLVMAEHSYSAPAAYRITATYAGDTNYSAVIASQQAIALASAPSAVTLRTWGDSITKGVGATTPSLGYASLTASAEGWALANYGVARRPLHRHLRVHQRRLAAAIQRLQHPAYRRE